MPIENTDTSFKLQDRTAVITGPCGTLVQSIALKFTQLGANVVLLDRTNDKAQRFATQLMDAREVHERYGRAVAFTADFSKASNAQDAVSRTAEAFGGVDIYIDAMMTSEAKRFKEPATLTDLDAVIEANLRAPLMMTHHVLRFLEGRKRGRVIYLMHDLLRLGLPMNSLTASTRSGLGQFARSLAREVTESNITVNCVAIGVTEELLLSQSAAHTGQANSNIQEIQTRLLQMNPNAQMMEPEKAANLIAFLASPLGSGITGQTIAVSQGLSFLS